MSRMHELARPESVLLEHELDRADSFVRLFVEIAGDAPTELDAIFARDIAALIWKLDREVGGAGPVAAAAGAAAWANRSVSVVAEAERGLTLRRVVMDEVRMTRQLWYELKEGARGRSYERPRLVKGDAP